MKEDNEHKEATASSGSRQERLVQTVTLIIDAWPSAGQGIPMSISVTDATWGTHSEKPNGTKRYRVQFEIPVHLIDAIDVDASVQSL